MLNTNHCVSACVIILISEQKQQHPKKRVHVQRERQQRALTIKEMKNNNEWRKTIEQNEDNIQFYWLCIICLVTGEKMTAR